jgi:hypothetical protein
MVIDGFTLAIAWAGGKAFESIGEALGYREAILAVCDAIGNGIADAIKKVITGGGAAFPQYGWT